MASTIVAAESIANPGALGHAVQNQRSLVRRKGDASRSGDASLAKTAHGVTGCYSRLLLWLLL